jgi:hypothetical protein
MAHFLDTPSITAYEDGRGLRVGLQRMLYNIGSLHPDRVVGRISCLTTCSGLLNL